MGILDAPVLPPTRTQNWIRNFRIQDVFATMASPPTLTLGTSSTSAVNGSYGAGTTMYNVQDAVFECLGGVYANGTTGGIATRRLQNMTLTTGSKTASVAPARVRFATNAEKFDLCFLESAFGQFNLLVDGQIVTRSKAVSVSCNSWL